VERFSTDGALYLGDDATDEDAFASDSVDVGVRVGRSPSSSASWFVASQGRVDDLLRAIVCARRRIDGLGEGVDGLVRMLA
jgi:trehalose-6-phosphatase